MESLLEQIKDDLSALKTDQASILERLEKIENNSGPSDGRNNAGRSVLFDASRGHGSQEDGATTRPHLPSSSGNIGTSGCHPTASSVAGGDMHDAVAVQDKFQSIKDKVSAVKVPPELRVGTSKAGIKREDQTTAAIIANCAKYVETSIKLMWNFDDSASQEDLLDLFDVQKAHIDYLRQEHSALVVSGQFGQKTSQLFKNLSRGTSNLDSRQLDSLLKAVQLTSNETFSRGGSSTGRYRGRGNFSSYNSGYNYGRGRGFGRGGGPGSWRVNNNTSHHNTATPENIPEV